MTLFLVFNGLECNPVRVGMQPLLAKFSQKTAGTGWNATHYGRFSRKNGVECNPLYIYTTLPPLFITWKQL